MGNVLVFSDKTSLAAELVSAGRMIGGAVYAVTVNQEEQAKELAACGVKVMKIDQPELCLADTAAIAAAINQAAEQANAEVVLLAASRTGKEIAGRLAQIMEAGYLADVKSVNINNGEIEGTRNALGGATLAVQSIKTAKKVLVISPKAFSPAAPVDGGSITDSTVAVKTSGVKLMETREKTLESVDIEAAEVLVAIGQGLDNQDSLSQVEAIAKRLNGEVACSKPVATDKKWLSEARVIGISGKICKPELAILMGISGQVQFSVGIRDAKTVITINNDENAPICGMSDYVLVADINQVIPELDSLLK